ncbi:hypothetical protein ACFL3Q_05310 [Planctomycetota bacterium]
MSKRPPLCGAKTRNEGTCRNRVPSPGLRCRFHRKRPLGVKSFLTLCNKTIMEVAAVGGAWALFEKVYPDILKIVNNVSGLIMPEHFWFLGFEPKSRKQMAHQIQEACKKHKRLGERYSSYRDSDKLAVEQAYRAILKRLEALEREK